MSMTPRLLRECEGHSSAVNAVRFTGDGQFAMSCSDDRGVCLWNPHRTQQEGQSSALLLKRYEGVHGYQVLDLTIAHDNSKFASCGGDKTCFLWDISSGRVMRRFHGHTQRINTVQMNNESTLLFSGSYDKSLRIWDLRSHMRDPVQILSDFKDSVTSIALSRSEIVVSCVDGKLRTYDMRLGQMHTDDLMDPIAHVCLSYDQKCALSSCLKGVVRLTEVSSGKVLQSYMGHKNNSHKVEAQFSSDDGKVIGGSEDGNIYTWDLVSAKKIYSFNAHSRAVSSISHHPSNASFLTSSYNGSIKYWDSSQIQSME